MTTNELEEAVPKTSSDDISIRGRALLVCVTVSAWTARRFDRKVSKEVADSKGAAAEAGRYNKHLFANSAPSHAWAVKLSRKVRDVLYAQTLAWSDEGWRLLPSANFMDFTDLIRRITKEFEDAVEEFLGEYEELVSQGVGGSRRSLERGRLSVGTRDPGEVPDRYPIPPRPRSWGLPARPSGRARGDYCEEGRGRCSLRYRRGDARRLEASLRDRSADLREALGREGSGRRPRRKGPRIDPRLSYRVRPRYDGPPYPVERYRGSRARRDAEASSRRPYGIRLARPPGRSEGTRRDGEESRLDPRLHDRGLRRPRRVGDR